MPPIWKTGASRTRPKRQDIRSPVFSSARTLPLSLPLATADLGRFQAYYPELKLLTPPGTVEGTAH